MTREEKAKYRDTDELREFLSQTLKGKKYRLDCHHITFGYHLGNDITIYNGKRLLIICSLCGH
jgi:hypothetical protein